MRKIFFYRNAPGIRIASKRAWGDKKMKVKLRSTRGGTLCDSQSKKRITDSKINATIAVWFYLLHLLSTYSRPAPASAASRVQQTARCLEFSYIVTSYNEKNEDRKERAVCQYVQHTERQLGSRFFFVTSLSLPLSWWNKNKHHTRRRGQSRFLCLKKRLLLTRAGNKLLAYRPRLRLRFLSCTFVPHLLTLIGRVLFNACNAREG